MKLRVGYKISESHSAAAQVNIPDTCPACGRVVVLNKLNTTFNNSKKELQLIAQCNFAECRSFVLLWYDIPVTPQAAHLNWSKIEPPDLTQESFPQYIHDISPDFISIFKEAHEAKERNLVQIAGPGYRKAFEFLIKDYAKSQTTPDKHNNIENLFAGNVVTQYISDTRIQAVAKRALWLGNDETHYLRKWVQQDINDLINLIKLTIHWIEIEQQSKNYVNNMPD